MISIMRKSGITMGGTNHDSEVPELVVLGKGLKVPSSSSRRAIATPWSSVWGSFPDLLIPANGMHDLP